MAQWGSSSDSGILRKNRPKDNHEDLLVFGYACKLFRDDEKAAYIDKGEHLIPWMADDKLKIDRYDCRGALSDLKPYEASREGCDAMRWLGLSDSDRKIEQLCDKERYYSLQINEEEEQMYKEEEQKRQQSNQFQYSYDVPQDPAQQEIGPMEKEEEDEAFVPSTSLDVVIPETVKENARIEKTALFVYKQGPQMEILIKAKQGNNPQFGFLNQDHQLYKYYRHVLAAIKNGGYLVTDVKKEEAHEEEVQTEEHYLHPSLTSTAPQPEVATKTPLLYKPSANCSYSQLVNRIQGQNEADKPAEMTYEQQQYYQYYYASQYYEYYKQMAQYQQGNGQAVQPPETHLDPNVQNYIQQMAYAQYLQQQQSNPYAQIVSNVSNKEPANPYAALLANMQAVTSPQSPNPAKETTSNSSKETKTVVQVPKPSVEIQKPLLSLAQYGSDSEMDEESEVKIPTGESQVVIDKMASYVAKNGEQFEEIVKGKGDPRFEFLKETHEFYKYYRNKIKEIKGGAIKDVKTVTVSPKLKDKKIIAPVSFSIKKPKDDVQKEIKSALPVEESDADDEPDDGARTPEQPPPEQNGAIFDDPILEMIDLTEDLEEKKDAKRAEDRIKDKLAAAAREKMVSAARDRALQLERKKKAAAFLKLKSAESEKSERSEKKEKTEERNNEKREVVQVDDSDEEKRKKQKKKHKRKHKHDKSKKKSKKRRRRSESASSGDSKSS